MRQQQQQPSYIVQPQPKYDEEDAFWYQDEAGSAPLRNNGVSEGFDTYKISNNGTGDLWIAGN